MSQKPSKGSGEPESPFIQTLMKKSGPFPARTFNRHSRERGNPVSKPVSENDLFFHYTASHSFIMVRVDDVDVVDGWTMWTWWTMWTAIHPSIQPSTSAYTQFAPTSPLVEGL